MKEAIQARFSLRVTFSGPAQFLFFVVEDLLYWHILPMSSRKTLSWECLEVFFKGAKCSVVTCHSAPKIKGCQSIFLHRPLAIFLIIQHSTTKDCPRPKTFFCVSSKSLWISMFVCYNQNLFARTVVVWLQKEPL